MRPFRKLVLASAIAVAAVCGMTGPASATTIDPANTNFTTTSTNGTLAVTGSSPNITWADSSINGTTPSGTATWLAFPVTLAYSSCTAFGLTCTVVLSEACHTAATQPLLHVMSVTVTHAVEVLTLRGCSFSIVIHSTGCTMTIPGNQTLGNGTAGAGGIAWTNLSPKSTAHWNNVVVGTIESNGTGLGCPSAGTHTGVIAGTYPVTSATNVTVTP